MKYIIEIEDEPMVRKSALYGEEAVYKIKGFPSLVLNKGLIDKLQPYHDNYQNGIDDAISTVKWLFKNVPDKDLFEFYFVEDILNLYSYQEIKDRIEQYEKNKNEFHVGDEFVDDGKIKAGKGVIISTYPNGAVDILWDDGSAGESFSTKDFKKTGRNFKQIAELLDLLNGRPQSPPEDMLDPCANCKYYDVSEGKEPCMSCKRHKGTEERWEPK